jgi:hypothetical protein
MNKHRQARRPKPPRQSGAAMLIAIFALLLISVVAIALVVSSGTDSSLAGNYRTSTSAYYAGVAGLEDARGRLLWKNLNFINKAGNYTNVLFDPSGILPVWCLNQVLYITNPASGETVDPTSSNPANYPDTEYAQEFPGGLGGATVLPYVPAVYPSLSLPGGGTLPSPTYKWVRINPVTEQALKIDVNGNGILESGMLYYDPANFTTGPGLIVSTQPPASCPLSQAPTGTAVEALEVTVLAVAPNGGTRLLQYIVAPLVISPEMMPQSVPVGTVAGFPAALTLDDGLGGGGVTFTPPSGFRISGENSCPPPPPSPPYQGSVSAVGYSSSADTGYVTTQANQNPADYPGAPITPPTPLYPLYKPTAPSLQNLGLPLPNTILRQTWLSPATLDAVMQDIENSADVVLTGPATGAEVFNAAPAMASGNPMTVVVNGDLTLNGAFGPTQTGNGLLLVTGTLTYHPSASWNGIILVVGKGQFLLGGNRGTGGINGTVFVAQTRDAAGNLLPTLRASFSTSGGSALGTGISYCQTSVGWAQGPLTYKVLSFHEIPLPN